MRISDDVLWRRRALLHVLPSFLFTQISLPPSTVEAASQCSGSAAPSTGGLVQDSAGFLSVEECERLERILKKLEQDTGFELRVLSRTRSAVSSSDEGSLAWMQGSASNILRCGFELEPSSKTALIVVRGLVRLNLRHALRKHEHAQIRLWS